MSSLSRSQLILILISGAVVLGAAGALLGPLWAAAGVVAGPVVAVLAVSVGLLFTRPEPEDLLRAGRHREALPMLDAQMPDWRGMARIWPGQFRDTLASQLLYRSSALKGAMRSEEALVPAVEAVSIYRELAAARPGKFAPDLAKALIELSDRLRMVSRREEALAAAEEAERMCRALAAGRPGKYTDDLAESLINLGTLRSRAGRHGEALAAATEAAGIYRDIRPGGQAAINAARALFLQGRILCDLSRYAEAAAPLARGCHIAASQENPGIPGFIRPALQAAYRADPAVFLNVWHTETDGDPPPWLASQDGDPP
jgi:tetratricopeptide (TPR) repeat protein